MCYSCSRQRVLKALGTPKGVKGAKATAWRRSAPSGKIKARDANQDFRRQLGNSYLAYRLPPRLLHPCLSVYLHALVSFLYCSFFLFFSIISPSTLACYRSLSVLSVASFVCESSSRASACLSRHSSASHSIRRF